MYHVVDKQDIYTYPTLECAFREHHSLILYALLYQVRSIAALCKLLTCMDDMAEMTVSVKPADFQI